MKRVLLKWSGFVICAAIAIILLGQSHATESESKHPAVKAEVGCLECHQSITPEEAAAWSASLHGQSGVGCFICHGDTDVEFYPEPDDDACISCHSGLTAEVDDHDDDDNDDDGDDDDDESCFSCHSGHTLKFHKKEGA